MAKAKRNLKTHPKNDGDPESYVAPDRPEVLNARNGESAEVVDLNSSAGEVDLGNGVDSNSAGEGDGISVEREEGNATREDRSAAADRGASAQGARDTRKGARATAAEGESDDDDARHSRKVRARIQRERANLNRERQLRQQTEVTLAEERTARQALADRLERVERAQTEVAGNADVKSLETQIAALLPQITAATEAGETSKALDLQIKLGELQGDLKLLKYDLKKKQEAATAAAEANRGRREQQTTTAADSREIDPVAKQTSNEFIKMNRHWWNRTKNREAREDAINIDKEVLAELEEGDLNFDKYSDEHFEEIAYRLHKTYPDLEICDLEGEPYQFDDDEDEDDMRNDRESSGRDRDRRDTRSDNRREARDERGRAPVGRGPGGIGRGGRRAPSAAELARQGKVTLEQGDFNTMRTFGMDPNNAEHKKYFAKERQRSILTDDRRNGGGR